MTNELKSKIQMKREFFDFDQDNDNLFDDHRCQPFCCDNFPINRCQPCFSNHIDNDNRDNDNRDRDNRDRDNRDEDCCCKQALKRSLNLLLDPCFKNLIDLTSFTLIGENFATAEGATTIKSVSKCQDSVITFSDVDCDLTMTTLCDLVAIEFNLVPFTNTNANSMEELITLFSLAVRRFIPPVNTKKFCCAPEEECCCNQSKASFLANSIGPVNILIDTNALSVNQLKELTVITVTKDIAWFVDPAFNIFIVCLDNIVALG